MPSRRIRRPGMTLVELLIVISVAVLLMAAAIPLLRMPLKDRKIREGSRQLSAFVMRCKARAAELRRPVGLLLRRASSGSSDFADRSAYATQMYMVETPPPYMGDDSTAGARIVRSTPPYQAQLSGSALFPVLVAVGDSIRFNYHGPLYRIRSFAPDPMNPTLINVEFIWPTHPNSVGPAVTPTLPTLPLPTPIQIPFQVYRSPYVATTGPATLLTNPPVDLPNGVVIDLSVSGMGATDNQFFPADPGDTSAVIIMFGPNGDVVRVYDSITVPGNPPFQLTDFDPSGSIFLLIGRMDGVIPTDVFTRGDINANLMDPTSIWVTIGHRTGKVTSTENASLDTFAPPPGQPVPPALIPTLFREARIFARGSQNIGGH